MPLDKKTAARHDIRPVRDASSMRALAHEVRWELLEMLYREGPLTATQAADLVGESPANCSWHLRQLAKYGFVEEAEGGKGRQRPWRLVSLGHSLSDTSLQGDERAASKELSALLTERHFRRITRWMATADTFPEEWRRGSNHVDGLLYLTPEELEEFSSEMLELAVRYQERVRDRSKRPGGARPVQFVGFVFPLPPTETGA